MSREKSYILDMIDASKAAIAYISELSEEEFYNNFSHVDAVIRRFEVLSEISRRLSIDYRASHPEIPWRKFLWLRNVIVLEYDTIDVEAVWKVVKEDLPDLISQLERIIENDE